MTKEELKAARQRLGLTQAGLAEKLGVSRRTVEAWESGRRNIPAPIEKLVNILEQGHGHV
jgi:putative transcriptional regulator